MSDTDRQADPAIVSAEPLPMTDADTVPPAGAGFEADAPLKGATLGSTDAGQTVGAGAAAEAGTDTSGDFDAGEDAKGEPVDLRQTLKDKAGEFRGQATEKVRAFAEDGKARATGALGELTKMLHDAADQVDDKLGGQYAQYARGAAERVDGFSASLDEKSLEDLLDMGRELVRKSPAVAIGTAATLGFVVARLLSAGFDQRDAA